MTDEMTEPPRAEENAADTRKMARATAGMSILTMAGFATGFVIKIILARLFGTQTTANTYNYVYRLTQDIFRTWDKLIRPTFLPVLSKERERVGEDDAWHFTNTIVTLQAVMLVVITLFLMVFSHQIVNVLTSFVPSDASVAGHYLMWIGPSVFFLGMAVTGYMLLNSYKRFQLAALGDHVFVKLVPCVSLIVTYGGLKIYETVSGSPVEGMATTALYALIAGIVLGAAAKLTLYVWGLRRHLRHLRLKLSLRSPAMRTLGILMLPLAAGVLVSFFRNRGEDVLLSAVLNGRAMTIVTYARAPVDIPVQLFPVALSIAIFPFLSDYFARKQHEQLFAILGKALRIILLVFLPLTLGMMLLSHALVDVVFGGGKFAPDDVRLTADALQWYAVGYVAFALEIVLLQFFYAAHQTFRPTYIGVATSLLQLLVLSQLIITDGGDVGAFTLAFSVSKAIKVMVLLGILALVYPHLKLWTPMLKRTGAALMKISLVTAVMGVVVYFLSASLSERLPTDRTVTGVLHLLITVGTGAVIFVAGVHVTGLEEWRQALDWVKGKLRRR